MTSFTLKKGSFEQTVNNECKQISAPSERKTIVSLYWESDYESTERRTHRAIQHALEFARNRNKVMDRRGRIICCDYELAAVALRGRLK